MINLAYVYAASWRGLGVSATAMAWADDAALDVVTQDGRMAIDIPKDAKKLRIQMTSTRKDFWGGEARFSIAGDGAITADDATAGSAVGSEANGNRITFIGVRVWRLRDVSDQVVKLLDPKNRPKLPDRAEKFDSDTDYPPAKWEILNREAIHFIDTDEPLVGDKLGITLDKPAAFEGTTMALELAVEGAPRLISVAWPDTLEPTEDSDPTPMLLYYRPGVGQNKADFFADHGMPAYPFNHDYAYYGQYQYLWYSRDPLTDHAFPKGLPHQVTESGKDLVTVIPCNGVGVEFGSFMKLEVVEEVLLEIQAFMFARAKLSKPPKELGRIAIGSFSSGCAFVQAILADPANRRHRLYTSTLREIYFFDPQVKSVDAVVAESLQWLKLGTGDRRVALYATSSRPALGKLLGWTAGKLPAQPSIQQTDDDSRIVAVIDVETWRRTIEPILGRKAPLYDFDHAHQQIASMFLTHALSKSDF